MARQPMTDEQKQAVAAKRQATRIANQEAKEAAAKEAAAKEAGDDDDEAMLDLLVNKDSGPAPKKGRRSNQSQKTLDAKAAAKEAATTPETDDVDDLLKEANKQSEPDDEDTDIELSMAQTLRRARGGYATTIRPGGDKSADCGDGIARALRDMEPEEVAAIADTICGNKAGFHQTKYQTLNRGQMRMNSGNKIRGAYKKAINTANTDRVNEIRSLLGMEEF